MGLATEAQRHRINILNRVRSETQSKEEENISVHSVTRWRFSIRRKDVG